MPTFNTDTPKPGYVYDSSDDTWYPLMGVAPGSSVDEYLFFATSGATTVSGVDYNGSTLAYTAGTEQVYLNGVLLVRNQDYSATSGTSIAGLSAMAATDVVTIITYNPSNIEKTDAILETDITAKGDLIVGTAVDTAGILNTGTNGQYLKVDTGTATGLAWGDPGDLTAVSAGTGITVTNGTGPVPSVAFDYRAGSAITLSAQTSNYTLVLTDADQKLVTLSAASTSVVSIPTNASVAFPTGTVVNIISLSTSQVTIQASTTSTTTISSTGATPTAPKFRAQFSAASCIKVATDTWYVVGDIA